MEKSFMYDESYEDSFMTMSRFLKMAGVRNNKFMLKLYDEDLQKFKVDPFKVDDKQLQEKIKTEAVNNIWYFLRNCVRLPVEEDYETGVPFTLNPVTMAEAYCFERLINLYIVSFRQQYRTNGVLACNIWSRRPLSFAYPVAKHTDARYGIMRQKELRSMLPSYLKETFKNISPNEFLADTRYYKDIECREPIEWEQKLSGDLKVIVNSNKSNDHLIIESSASGTGGGNDSILSELRTKYWTSPLHLYDLKGKRKLVYMELDADLCGVSEYHKSLMRTMLFIPDGMKKEDMNSWQLAELYLERKHR